MGSEASDISLVWVGRTAAEYAKVGLAEYLERIRRYRTCGVRVAEEQRQTGRFSREHRLQREGESILEIVDDLSPAFAVAVDPRGRELESRRFAELVRRQCYDDTRILAFVVGGPDGLAPGVRERADTVLSLGRMTLPHDLARLVLTEQIYRAFTLIHGHPYSR